MAICTSPPRAQLWADRYKPQTTAQMCYPVCANKLKAWLQNFEPAGVGDLRRPRGALLSGPPGIGKTTSVHVVSRELGRTVIEYNASDFRSRKSLRERVAGVTTNVTFSNNCQSYVPIVLLMDEVDGCDVGGVGEVMEMLKHTQVPIVCTCNDRWHPKLRSLLNHVEDIRCIRPPCNIVANYLCDRVLAQEGIQLEKPVLQDIIKRAGSDIRNMLNNLQLWCLRRSSLEQKQLAQCAAQGSKNGDVGLFDAAEYFLMQGTSHGEHHSIAEMQAAYYQADLVDMFVQENYLRFNPEKNDEKADWMQSVCRAARCISRSDAVQRMMYGGEQNWSAARAHVLLSSVAPCVYTRGRYESFVSGQQAFFDRQRPVKFPSWLGHNSSANKHRRWLRMATMAASNPLHGLSAGQEDVALDYIPRGWRRKLVEPLVRAQKEGIADVIAVMDCYGLMREDWDFVVNSGSYKHRGQPRVRRVGGGASEEERPLSLSDIPTAVKLAFTREFNRTHATDRVAKVALEKASLYEKDTQEENENDMEEDHEDENDEEGGVGAGLSKRVRPTLIRGVTVVDGSSSGGKGAGTKRAATTKATTAAKKTATTAGKKASKPAAAAAKRAAVPKKTTAASTRASASSAKAATKKVTSGRGRKATTAASHRKRGRAASVSSEEEDDSVSSSGSDESSSGSDSDGSDSDSWSSS